MADWSDCSYMLMGLGFNDYIYGLNPKPFKP